MEEHVCRARMVRACIGANDRVEAKNGADGLPFEPAVQEVGRAPAHERKQVTARIPVEARGKAARPQDAERVHGAAAQGGRALEREFPKESGNSLQHPRVRGVALRVGPGETGELRLRDGEAPADAQEAPVFHGQEVRAGSLQDPKPVLGKVKLAYDRRMEETHRVRGNGVAESRMKRLCHRAAAHDIAALQHQDLQPCPRQVACAHQAVVAGAHDDHVPWRAVRRSLHCDRGL